MISRFSSVWDKRDIIGDKESIQRSYFLSLKYLERLYKFKISRFPQLPFPKNISAITRSARCKIEEMHTDTTLFITTDDAGNPCLCTAQGYPIGNNTLYYIPISPLYKYCQKQEAKLSSNLLLSVLAYLYNVVKVPYYRDKDTFLHSCYWEVEQWLIHNPEEEQNEDDLKKDRELFDQLKVGGDFILQRIGNQNQLSLFGERLESYQPTAPVELKIKQVATDAYALFQKYPKYTLSDCIPEHLFNPEEEDRLYAESYVSFFWDFEEEKIYNELLSYISSRFENCMAMDLPVGYQLFNQPHYERSHDLEFAKSLFTLIENLTEILIDIT